ncbi:hypothetical protein [Coxiella burnetii]|uniref:hypothetical protein n=1 Tax=Coxiella burnetii TaxID=777 RepID=UPI0009B5B507|nr:hypothetical protein [Coxiella burnetii]AZV75157.1 hypothetical protein D6219_04565 [Coxiella burnetii]MDE3399676.1 hypothetical protein [Coxiella burnetii]OYK90114.1 hypothetical protein CbuQ195_08000 [Coxiella burnetii]PNT78503.1 hypothetical protein C2L92_10745 [Coxiella burnetii]PNT79013.1 hypothetical protein C2L91_10775 [Coxiella burnetii]
MAYPKRGSIMESSPQPNHRFTISDILNEAWGLVNGSKWSIWAIAIFIGIASLIAQIIIIRLFQIDPEMPSVHYNYFFMPLINSIVIAPFFAGAVMTAISRARGEAVSPRSGYQYFRKTLPVMLGMLLITFLATIVNYIVHLPPIATAVGRYAVWLNILGSIVAIFVYVFTILTIPLIVDKNHTPWDGLIASFRLVKPYWFKVFMLILIIYVFFIVATIPLIVGSMIHPYARLLGAGIFILILVWLLPYIFLIQGVLYHKLVD